MSVVSRNHRCHKSLPYYHRTIYQLFIPANMMFSRYLESCSKIMAQISGQKELSDHMHTFASSIRASITKYGIVNDPVYGKVYAYEVDGFGSGKSLVRVSTPQTKTHQLSNQTKHQQTAWTTPIFPLSLQLLSSVT